MAAKRIVFVGGAPRSGTTALMQLLNCHPEVYVTDERFYHSIRKGTLTPDMFERDRFLAFQKGDGNRKRGDNFVVADPAARYESACYVGDKFPPFARGYDLFRERFADATLIAIVRNPMSVAESYQRRADDADDHWKMSFRTAITQWNKSVATMLREARARPNLHVVSYERLFTLRGDVRKVFGLLDLSEPVDQVAVDSLMDTSATLAMAEGPRMEELRFAIARRADFASYRRLLKEHDVLGSGKAEAAEEEEVEKSTEAAE